MKKIIICLLIAIIATNCEVKVKETKAQERRYNRQLDYINIDGMRYAVFTPAAMSTSGDGGIFVINLTKDELEVQLLKKQLN